MLSALRGLENAEGSTVSGAAIAGTELAFGMMNLLDYGKAGEYLTGSTLLSNEIDALKVCIRVAAEFIDLYQWKRRCTHSDWKIITS